MPSEILVQDGLAPYHFAGMVYKPAKGALNSQTQRLLLIGDYEGDEETLSGLSLITSPEDINKLFPDEGSTLSKMLQTAVKVNPMVEKYAYPLKGETLLEALAKLPEVQFTQIAASSCEDLTAVNEMLEKRWNPTLQIDGHLFLAESGSVAELTEKYKEINNLTHISLMAKGDSESPSFLWAASLAAVNAAYAQKPFLPYHSLLLAGVKPPKTMFSLAQRNILLKSGISTHFVEGKTVKIDRLVSMYSKDSSYRDLNKKQILSYLRYDFVKFLKSMYPRHALSQDESQADGDVATPKSARDLAIARHLRWKKEKYVQDPDAEFKNLVRVWVDENNGETLRFYLPVQLMGQLRRTITTIAFTP